MSINRRHRLTGFAVTVPNHCDSFNADAANIDAERFG